MFRGPRTCPNQMAAGSRKRLTDVLPTAVRPRLVRLAAIEHAGTGFEGEGTGGHKEPTDLAPGLFSSGTKRGSRGLVPHLPLPWRGGRSHG